MYSILKISTLLFTLLLVSPQNIIAENSDNRGDHNAYHFSTDQGLYVLQFYNPEILEVSFFPEGEKVSAPSHAVVMEQEEIAVEMIEDENQIVWESSGLSARFDKNSQRFSFFYKNRYLLSERSGFVSQDSGFRTDFRISESEVLMGGGSRALGMNRRGHKLRLYNRAHYGYGSRSDLVNFTLPMVLSSKLYAIHFDNPTTGYLDLDSENNNTLGFEAMGGPQRYQIIADDNWEGIVQNYTRLTGLQPLPPRWALGNFSSRFGYQSQQEVMDTIEKFRKEEIPVDAVILDLFWFGKEIQGTMGNLAFDLDSFPDPKRMIRELADDGVKTILITEPFILTTSDRWDEAVENDILAKDTLGNPATYDFYFGNTGLIDVFKPEAIDWFWNIYEELKQYGVHGWWGDLGEPEVHPEYLQHHTGSANEVHNIYGHQWAKIIHDGYKENYPNDRPFILMRAGYSGSQHIGMIPWTGDVSRSWGGLKAQPELSLQMGLQGMAYLHSDLGGFAGGTVDDELYARWMQYGVFQPVYRPHANHEIPPEPVYRSEEAMKLAKKALELRYQLLPYMYTLAFENSQSGQPFMRPLFYEEPDNFELYHVSGTYLFGDDFLISPIVEPGVSQQNVYFPGESRWFDFYTNDVYEGGNWKRVTTEETYIPTFVRGGAIIPTIEIIQTSDDYSVSDLNLYIFYDETVSNATAKVYHDDGLTADAYQKSEYEILHVATESSDGHFEITFNKETGKAFSSEFETITLNIRNTTKNPKEVRLGDQSVQFMIEDDQLKISEFNLEQDRSVIRIEWEKR